MLAWILAGISAISAIGAAASLVYVRTRLGIDKATLTKMRREQAQENAEIERKRKEEDARRNRERIEADERRNALLRDELGQLAERSNKRFAQWQDTVSDLDELWAAIEDELLPWIRQAYRKLIEANIDIPPPPSLRDRRNNIHKRRAKAVELELQKESEK